MANVFVHGWGIFIGFNHTKGIIQQVFRFQGSPQSLSIVICNVKDVRRVLVVVFSIFLLFMRHSCRLAQCLKYRSPPRPARCQLRPMNILKANMVATSEKSEKVQPRYGNELAICTYSAKEGPKAKDETPPPKMSSSDDLLGSDTQQLWTMAAKFTCSTSPGS